MSVQLKKVNINGDVVGTVVPNEAIANATANSQLVKDYIVAIRANARQWSANTKGRSEVNHSTKKPHAQKGQGRSRQGSLAAPQYKGGGRVFGPKPKFDQHVRINQKEKRAAIAALIGEKMREGRLVVLESFDIEAPKTKLLNTFLNKTVEGVRVLFLGEGAFEEFSVDGKKHRVSVQSNAHVNLRLSIRNIPGVQFSQVQNVCGYDLLLANDIVISEKAMQDLYNWLLQKDA